MPVSRTRKVQKARKRPRVPHSTETPNPLHAPTASNNRNLGIAAAVLLILVAGGVIAFLMYRGNPTASAEVTMPSGLKITDIKVGDGPSPKMGQTVQVHYTGALENGTEFNNTYKMGRPAEFTLGEVIPGWNEGLQTMKVGGKRRLFIPSNLAYGPRGRGASIPPNSNLVFVIELLAIR